MNFMQFTKEKLSQFGDLEFEISRTGYTGEDGFEVVVSNSVVEDFVTGLLQFEGATPAGLGARDLLRLEAGYCLHGNDISRLINPVEGMLQWVIRKSSQHTNFIGYE